MSQLIETLTELNRLKAHLAELPNRVYGLQIGICTDNHDPLNQRRIKVAPQSKGGQATSEWLAHCNPDPGRDAPIPSVGSTIFYQFLDGDPHDGVWLGVTHNDTNPPDPTQSDPVNDCAVEVPGNDRRTVVGDSTHQTVGDRIDEIDKSHNVKVEESFTLTTHTGEISITATEKEVTIKGKTQVRLEDGSGGYVVMSGGVLRMGNASGQEWVMGGSSGSEWTWNAAGEKIAITNAHDVTINGKSVLVLGSVDTRGDSNVTKGY